MIKYLKKKLLKTKKRLLKFGVKDSVVNLENKNEKKVIF